MSAIDELKALEASATAAPWKVAGVCAECTCGKPETHGSIQVTDKRGISRNVVDGFRCANASNDVQLIALLRNRAADLIALAEAVREWKEAEDALDAAFNKLRDSDEGDGHEEVVANRWRCGDAAIRARTALRSALARVDNNGEGER
jgi:hypothetical protein